MTPFHQLRLRILLVDYYNIWCLKHKSQKLLRGLLLICLTKQLRQDLSIFLMSLKVAGLKELSQRYSHFFFDLDGVIWRGPQPIPGGVQALHYLRGLGKNLYFVTNSSVRNRQVLKQRFSDFGFETFQQQLYPATYMSSLYINHRHSTLKKVLVVGSNSLCEQVRNTTKVQVVHLNDVELKQGGEIQSIRGKVDKSIDGVLMGYDFAFNYAKLCYISLVLQQPGVTFLGTNPDKFTMIGGYKMPGNGSMLTCVEEASDRKAEVCGKPNPFVLNLLIEERKLDPKQCLMIGDNINTDIRFAINAGVDSLCVLTGNTNEEEVLANNYPTYYAERLL